MASWGDVQTYEDMIADLGTFKQQISDACGVMTVSAQQCVEELDSDTASLKACSAVLKSVQKFQKALELTDNLIAGLRQEEEMLIEIIKKSEELERD